MRNFLLSCFIVSAFVSCAQVKHNIVQSKASYYLRMPGALLVDENGLPVNKTPDTIRVIYLEVKGNIPQFETAWVYGQSFNLVPTMVAGNSVTIGKKMDSDEQITFKAAEGHSLLALELIPGKQVPMPEKAGKDEILLQGIKDKKKFLYTVKNIMRVASPEFM